VLSVKAICRAAPASIFSVLALLVGTIPLCAYDWPTADPVALGLSTRGLRQYRNLCRDSGADACLVSYRGRLVLEWYGPGYTEPAYTMSSVKSWTALLVGLLIRDGLLASVDEPVFSYFPEWRAGRDSGVTIRQLLTMTSGLRGRTTASGADRSIGYVEDKLAYLATLVLDWKPGERWDYSNEGAQLLSPVLTAAAREPLGDYARRTLFQPLGMDHTRFHEYPAGQVWTYADAETTLREFATIGQLILDHGVYAGQEVVPSSWIDACLEPSERNRRYGYLWWIHYKGERTGLLRRLLGRCAPSPSAEVAAYATEGYLNTDCYVLPATGIVAARVQARPKDKVREYDRDKAIEILMGVAE
jgi:CubicO group peptidase (beta-lactamase class C family)